MSEQRFPRAFVRKVVVATLVMLMALVGTSWLGLWQYSVAYRHELAQQVSKLPERQLTDITAIGSYLRESDYGRRVSARGQLDCSRSVIVGESTPLWLACPLELSDGSLAAVVVGLAPAERLALSAREVSVTGRVQPSQDTTAPPAIYPRPAPKRVDLLGTAELTQRWSSDVRDGFVVASAKSSRELGLAPVQLDSLAYPPQGIELRNLFYAWQWWLFAGFALFLWARYLRDEWRLVSADAER